MIKPLLIPCQLGVCSCSGTIKIYAEINFAAWGKVSSCIQSKRERDALSGYVSASNFLGFIRLRDGGNQSLKEVSRLQTFWND